MVQDNNTPPPTTPAGASPSSLGNGVSIELPPITGLQQVNVRLEIRIVDNKYVAELDDGQSMLEDLPIGLTPEDVRQRSASLRGEIQAIISGRGDNLYFSQAEAEDALGRLAEQGHAAFNQIFSDPNALSLLNDVVHSGNPTSIEVVADSFVLPWELLYDRDLSQPISVDGFWGFKYIIGRLFRGRSAGALITSTGAPVVSLFTDSSLNSVSASEVPFFQSLNDSGLVILRPLRALDNSKRRNEILQGLIPFMQQPIQVAHFACHALPGVSGANSAALTLSNGFQITLDDMRAYNMNFTGQPLVVLNACGTGIRDPLVTSNFVREMITSGARGVVATETDVPDTFAAAFVRDLYREHLLKGETLGNALLASRRHFQQEYSNPVGLIYALYARASLRLVRQGVSPSP